MGIILNANGESATRDIVPLGFSKMRRFIEFEQLLKRLGMGLICTHCSRTYGPPWDGIQGKVNDRGDEISLECRHASRVLTLDDRTMSRVAKML
jgi:hypothetical protein